jgi:hypothetical protein
LNPEIRVLALAAKTHPKPTRPGLRRKPSGQGIERRGGRYRDRTCGPFHVKEVLSR